MKIHSWANVEKDAYCQWSKQYGYSVLNSYTDEFARTKKNCYYIQ